MQHCIQKTVPAAQRGDGRSAGNDSTVRENTCKGNLKTKGHSKYLFPLVQSVPPGQDFLSPLGSLDFTLTPPQGLFAKNT